MSPLLEAMLRSWPFAPSLAVSLLLTAAIYLRGWLALYKHNREHWRVGQPVAFVGGLVTIYLALASPIEPLASLLLQVHMVQHLLLMMAAPALFWLGAPITPILRGLPRPVATEWLGPPFASRPLQLFFARLTHPAVTLSIFVA